MSARLSGWVGVCLRFERERQTDCVHYVRRRNAIIIIIAVWQVLKVCNKRGWLSALKGPQSGRHAERGVCGCVCVCERERERERRDGGLEKSLFTVRCCSFLSSNGRKEKKLFFSFHLITTG